MCHWMRIKCAWKFSDSEVNACFFKINSLRHERAFSVTKLVTFRIPLFQTTLRQFWIYIIVRLVSNSHFFLFVKLFTPHVNYLWHTTKGNNSYHLISQSFTIGLKLKDTLHISTDIGKLKGINSRKWKQSKNGAYFTRQR